MRKRIKNILVCIWNKIIDYKIVITNKIYILVDRIKNLLSSKPKVLSIDETLDYIIKNKCSVSRFGDGELKLMTGQRIFFQSYSNILENRLKDVIKNNEENLMVCIPDIFGDLSLYEKEPFNYWTLHRAKTRNNWYGLIYKNKSYGNAFISRCYYGFKDKKNCKDWFKKIKSIWKNRDIVIIEGKKSRLGIGNDLFKDTRSIERILCPEKDAFNRYEKILNEANKNSRDKLILLAIGPTATILAYDLCKNGYQAIDIGHIDIEYEWFLMGATKKEKVKNKFVGEAIGGDNVAECNDKEYLNQVKIVID